MPQHKQDPSEPVPTATRRQVLAGTAAGVAVVATGALAATGAEAVVGAAPRAHESGRELADGEHLVAHVRDLRTGDIDVFVGERQVTIRDRAVAARLAAATD